MKKIILPLIMMIIGIGFGIGGMIIKDIIAPKETTVNVLPERKPDEVGPLVEVGEIKANLKGGGIVLTQITLEGANKKSQEVIEPRLVFVRDKINQILISRTSSDINSTEGLEALKVELLSEINEMVADNVKQVLYSSFIFSR